MRQGEDDAFDGASDAVLAALYATMIQTVWGDVHRTEWVTTVRAVGSFRSKFPDVPARDVYEMAMVRFELEEWGRDKVDDWTPASPYVVFSASSLDRFRKDLNRG